MEYNATMERMMRSSDTALRVQTAKAQQLEHALREAEEQAKGLHHRLQTTEAQIARLYDVIDDKDHELAAALAAATAATDLLQTAQAQGAATAAQLNAALAVVNAARVAQDFIATVWYSRPADDCAEEQKQYNALNGALEDYDAAQQAQPEAKP